MCVHVQPTLCVFTYAMIMKVHVHTVHAEFVKLKPMSWSIWPTINYKILLCKASILSKFAKHPVVYQLGCLEGYM